ncbi:MAG: ribosomal protein S18-alanine N-acetyltransferase [Acidimicrobiales bacterium]|nr:ribosomal protein S18-alanine N-acetyltransferase [Acidimicrobiales bacterium]
MNDADPTMVAIEPMRRRHLRSVLRIEAAAEHEGWSLGLFLAELRRDTDRCYLVARVDGVVAGFAGMLFTDVDGHLVTMATDPAWRRRGIATGLLVALAHEARRRGMRNLTLEVRAGNAAAQSLYRSFGFAPVGVRRGYYADGGEDAVVMWAEGIDGDGYAERLRALAARPPSGATAPAVPISTPGARP